MYNVPTSKRPRPKARLRPHPSAFPALLALFLGLLLLIGATGAQAADVSGTVSLQSVASGNLAQPLTVLLQPTGGGSITTYSVTPAASDGSFTLTGLPSATFNLYFKGSKWLQKAVAVDTTGGNVTGLSVTLLGGDLDANNVVDANDFLILRNQYNSTGSGLAGDITCDGTVDFDDFLILRDNFNAVGDVPVPLVPTGLSATPNNGQITLTWAAPAASPAYNGATGYNVKRSTTSGGPYTTVASPTATYYTDTGLTDGTTYYYVVSATNAGGESSNSSQTSATPTTTPQGLTVTGGDGQNLLTWTPVVGATGYNVYQSTTSGSYGSALNTSPGASNAYLDTGLTNGTTYYYKVTAVVSGTESTKSAEASATPAAQDSNWSVSVSPTNSSSTDTTANTSTAVSLATTIQTTAIASAAVSGVNSTSVSKNSQAATSGTWTFTWTGSSWPTLYVIQHLQKRLYSASINDGSGSVSVANTGGSTLVSASSSGTGTAISGQPATSISVNTVDLTAPIFTTASTLHLAGAMPAPGTTSGTMTGWSEMSNNTTLTQTAYTQAWFQAHFSSYSSIVLTFTVSATDVTASTSLSSSASDASADALATVSDLFAGN